MSSYSFLPPVNFLGLPPECSSLEHSRALLLPVPYDATTSYKGGAKEGPSAILEASQQVELYDAEFGIEPAAKWGIHTLPSLAPNFSAPEAMVADISAAVADFAGSGKLLGVLGGEHTVSVGVARGLAHLWHDFLTVQLDAHADLRDTYDGTPYSHACTARRILEISPVLQLGIRSLDSSEAAFIQKHSDRLTTIFAEEMAQSKEWLQTLADRVAGRSIFLTLDLDVFDPSVMPATGTPEPGGLLWREVLEIVRTIASHANIIAFDCVELAPIPALHAPNFTAAKLVYKIISIILARKSLTLS